MQRFLCWDKKNFSENNGVAVVQHRPEMKNLALTGDDPWEGVHNGYACVIKVGDAYRMYYRADGQRGEVHKDESVRSKSLLCVAESKDGIAFTKPVIGKVEYNGSKENNAVFTRDNGKRMDTFTVFYDTNPNCPPEEKFKGLARDSGTTILDFFISADGYDFTFVQEIKLNGSYDSYNTVFWDDVKRQYCLYYRGFHSPDGTVLAGMPPESETANVRDIRLAVSKDFRNWDFVGLIEYEDGKDIQLYTNQIAPYYRDKKTLIGFPSRYYDRVAEKENYYDMPIADLRCARTDRGATALTDCVIMTSTDGLLFDRRSSAFLTPGPENSANWWYGDCYTAYGMVETVAEDGENREISMYVGENYRVKKVDFRRFTVRLDGFFSWYGDGDGAVAVTKPFVLEKENMFVNFGTSALGALKITLLDKGGAEIPGYESNTLFGDSTNRPVRFSKSLRELVGKEIMVKAELTDCHLYSFTFE